MKYLFILMVLFGCKNSTPEPKLTTIHIVVGKDTVKINNGQWIDVMSVRCSSGNIDWDKGITTIEICKSDSTN